LAFKLLEKHEMRARLVWSTKKARSCSAVDAGHRPRRGSWKKRMREYGSVSIPQEAFIAALRMGKE